MKKKRKTKKMKLGRKEYDMMTQEKQIRKEKKMEERRKSHGKRYAVQFRIFRIDATYQK